MDTIRLVMADMDEVFKAEVERLLTHVRDFELVASTDDGERALSILSASVPDILLTGLALRGRDGLSVLRAVKKNHIPTICIVCSYFSEAANLVAAQRSGAHAYISKPVDVVSLFDSIREYVKAERSNQSSVLAAREDDLYTGERVHKYLIHMGFSPRHIGSRFLEEAIRRSLIDPSQVENLEKGLYSEIAEAYHTKPICVERCIRTAIHAAHKVTSNDADSEKPRTNRKFILDAIKKLR